MTTEQEEDEILVEAMTAKCMETWGQLISRNLHTEAKEFIRSNILAAYTEGMIHGLKRAATKIREAR